jgi:pimeloyl-ACP methyl ester carboxylesterase
MPVIEGPGYPTYYEDDDFTAPWESAETVLIQHGFGRNSQFWYHWVPALAGDFRVIRRDLRGHGSSGNGGDTPWSFDGLVDDLCVFIDALKLDRVHLVGESTGGMLAVALAVRGRRELRSLTLCASPTTISVPAQHFFAGNHASWQEALLALGSEGWARWLMAKPGTFPSADPGHLEWAVRQFGRASTRGLASYSAVISATDVADLLPRVGVPALVLAPTRSAATPPQEQERIAAAIPGAVLVPIDGRGHEIYIDRAEECIAALRRFVSSIPG